MSANAKAEKPFTIIQVPGGYHIYLHYPTIAKAPIRDDEFLRNVGRGFHSTQGLNVGHGMAPITHVYPNYPTRLYDFGFDGSFPPYEFAFKSDVNRAIFVLSNKLGFLRHGDVVGTPQGRDAPAKHFNVRTYANIFHRVTKARTQAPDLNKLKPFGDYGLTKLDADALVALTEGRVTIRSNPRGDVLVSAKRNSIERLVRAGALDVDTQGKWQLLPYGDKILDDRARGKI